MTLAEDPDTEMWLLQARAGSREAVRRLFDRHRDRLRRMIGLRLDHRLAARLDASDVVQETLMDAAQRLESYLDERPLPFYPWLQRLALERIALTHRHHLFTQRREAGREAHNHNAGNDPSAAWGLVDALAESGTSPSGCVIREEDREAIRRALCELADLDREVLMMRYVDQLSFAEIAAILDVTEGAARQRHLRALKRIAPLLGPAANGGPEA